MNSKEEIIIGVIIVSNIYIALCSNICIILHRVTLKPKEEVLTIWPLNLLWLLCLWVHVEIQTCISSSSNRKLLLWYVLLLSLWKIAVSLLKLILLLLITWDLILYKAESIFLVWLRNETFLLCIWKSISKWIGIWSYRLLLLSTTQT